MTAGAISCAKLHLNDYQPTSQHLAFYRAYVLPGEQPTVSKHNYNDGKPNWCDICSAKITTNKNMHSACKSVDV